MDAPMSTYALSDVAKLLGMSRSAILGLVRAGFVAPERGARRQYRFSFQDLVLLRAARDLSGAKVPPRRITRSLKALRRRLPADVPLSGLRIAAVGDRVVVAEGRDRWQADSGQYLLDLDVSIERGALTLRSRHAGRDESPATRDAETWFGRGVELEAAGEDRSARDAYARAIALDPEHVAARINLGRMLHEAGLLERAERIYRDGIERGAADPLLLFNFATLLEDLGRREEAIEAYRSALREDPQFADCHYNLALACEAAGDPRGAIRHMGEYRKLVRAGGR
jgi:tetratricopeptide (TPR) repeat protein